MGSWRRDSHGSMQKPNGPSVFMALRFGWLLKSSPNRGDQRRRRVNKASVPGLAVTVYSFGPPPLLIRPILAPPEDRHPDILGDHRAGITLGRRRGAGAAVFAARWDRQV